MFSAKCRFSIKEMERILAQLLIFSPDSSPKYNSKTAIAVSGTGLSSLFLVYYGARKYGDNKILKLIKEGVVDKLSLNVAGNTKKAESKKTVRNVAAVATATISQVTSTISVQNPAVSAREKRFLEFASVEYDGQAFMTPLDFLEAAIYESPTIRRLERHAIGRGEAEKMLSTRGSPTKDYFRSLGHNGLISYTEYLFLLCILTKPQTSFRVAFNMLDVDGNSHIDKKEFLVMERIFGTTKFSKRLLQGHQFDGPNCKKQSEEESNFLDQMNQLHQASDTHEHPHVSLTERNQLSDNDNSTDTILMRRFFGRRGRHVLTYDEFHKFMEDLQTEILEMEFNEFSYGLDFIKERDFAKLLLRHAFAHRDAYLSYVKRVEERVKDTTGITFEQYRQFCLFLTNLDDFAMAVKLYTYRDLPVTQSEFARAAKVSTGFALDPHLVNTVFQIFDINEDGRLSYGEFISVMRDRLNRGAKRAGPKNEWQQFKKCVREEMRRY